MPTIVKTVQALGADTFTALKDTPGTFDGSEGLFAMVNQAGSKIVFQAPFQTEGLVGVWIYGDDNNTGEFSADQITPQTLTTFTLNNTDQAADKTAMLHFLEPGDRLEIQALIGDNVYDFVIDDVNTATAGKTIYRVTYRGGSTNTITAGDSYNVNSIVSSTENIGSIRFRPMVAAPANPKDGMVYYNGNEHKLKVYANGAWVDLN